MKAYHGIVVFTLGTAGYDLKAHCPMEERNSAVETGVYWL